MFLAGFGNAEYQFYTFVACLKETLRIYVELRLNAGDIKTILVVPIT